MRYQLLIIFRRILREKTYFVINILGLTTGMAAALLILLFIQVETHYDTFHPNHRNIYRVANDFHIKGQGDTYAVSSAALGPALHRDHECFESFLRIFYLRVFFTDLVLLSENRRIDSRDIYAVDSTFFDFFSTRFIQGSPDDALISPFSLVLSRSMAEKYFGHTDILGEEIVLSNMGKLIVTAVVEDPPLNSHFHYQALLSIGSLAHMDHFFENALGAGVNWDTFENQHFSFLVWTYLKTNGTFDPLIFKQTEWPEHVSRYHTQRADGYSLYPKFQAFRDIHLHSNYLYENGSGNVITRAMNIQIIGAFLLVAVFLLFISAINYTNFTISQFNKRKRSLGMSKVVGGGRRDIFASFFVESFATSLVALFMALFLLEWLMPIVNENLGLTLNLNFRENNQIIWVIFSVFSFTSIISGMFPALYFTNTPISKLLEKRNDPLGRSLLLKKTLVSCQFAIALFMISIGLVVQSQYKYMQKMDWGFNSENIVVIELYDRESKSNFAKLDSILSSHPLVKSTAATDYAFGMVPIRISSLFASGNDSIVCSFFTAHTSYDFLDLMGLGNEGISREKFESGNALVNQRLLDSLSFETIEGKKVLTHFQYLGGKLRQERAIAGVLDDFHYANFNRPLEPLIFLPMPPDKANYLAVHFHGNDRKEQLKALEESWMAFHSSLPSDYAFLEDTMKTFFDHQNILAKFFGYFSIVAVLIAFLGVFGITAYNISQKSVEISIRKTLGAGMYNIFMIFARYYIGLFLIGASMGSVLSIYILQRWLNTFAYATSISLWHILLPAIMVASAIVLAIGLHMIKIKNMEPAIALRQE